MSELQCRQVDLSRINNKNEKRVIAAMEKVLGEIDGWDVQRLDIQDIYALALNRLPPRYVQDGTIVFNEPVRKEDIEEIVREAVEIVRNSPNY